MDPILLSKLTNVKTPHKHHDKNVKDAALFEMYYTGEINDKTLFEYRESEDDTEKKQRRRIFIPRTKHTCSNVENILDSLHVLDTTAVKITTKNPESEKQLLKMMTDYNVEKQSFDFVKHSTMTDANSFAIGGKDEDGDIVFEMIKSSNVMKYKIVNNSLKYLVAKFPSEDPKENDELVIYTPTETIFGQLTKAGDYIPGATNNVGICYAIHLGYKPNPTTGFKTFKTILEPASNLLKELVQTGSEYDTIKNCHGIERMFAFAPVCDYSAKTEKGIEYCRDGNVYMGDTITRQCPSCKGSGLKIHTSSQNVIYLPEPRDKQEYLGLDKLVHTVHINGEVLSMFKKDIQELQNEIIRTVFNSNTITKEDFAKTATETKIDQNGVYSALSHMGNKVSEVVKWMVGVLADMEGIKEVEVFHGYTMDLNLDTLTDLIDTRQKAVSANASHDIIKVIDYAILKKQHMDNPEFINAYSIWETFKPFNDKSEGERATILSELEPNNRDRVLYYWFSNIKSMVLAKYPKFYEQDTIIQKGYIDEAIDEIIAQWPAVEPQRANLKDIEDDSEEDIVPEPAKG